MEINELKDFISKNYCSTIEFTKENSYYSMKCQKRKIYYNLQPN